MAAAPPTPWRGPCRGLPPLARAAQPLPQPRRTATLLPAGSQLHIHFHGVPAEDVAAISARDQPDPVR